MCFSPAKPTVVVNGVKYRKIPIICPGLIFVQRAFLLYFLETLYGILSEGLIFRGGVGAYRNFTVAELCRLLNCLNCYFTETERRSYYWNFALVGWQRIMSGIKRNKSNQFSIADLIEVNDKSQM